MNKAHLAKVGELELGTAASTTELYWLLMDGPFMERLREAIVYCAMSAAKVGGREAYSRQQSYFLAGLLRLQEATRVGRTYRAGDEAACEGDSTEALEALARRNGGLTGARIAGSRRGEERSTRREGGEFDSRAVRILAKRD